MTKSKIEYIHKENISGENTDIHTTLIRIAETIDDIFESDLGKRVEFFLVVKTPVGNNEEGLGIISNNDNKDHLIEILRSRLDFLESQFKKANNELN